MSVMSEAPSLERLRALPFVTEKGAQLLLRDVAQVRIEEGPPMLRSENARLSGWVYVDVRGRDLRSVVHDMQAAVADQVAMPPGYSLSWSGQFEYLERATERPVIDRTGLSGQFDLSLQFNPGVSRLPEGRTDITLAELEERPTIFTAVREQFGLKLEPATAPLDVLVIDAVERPTPD